ncbi:ABC transporter substrate-binding protein [Zestomonas carbonaria]|uniref:Solute-binding protein family 3/N-terminal domain-containing protein n=1 Tax=Zestomonas carbonaria TaxID=2762745 RepID=A0A7U7EQW4_9GAMM|nr:ABC transporter substrate-binding protein [Pseudomonas carbonaria]CAD5109518.1 hypothetical protein PSEWESI4_03823 [Pseudomonas carbonaria]
MNTRLIGFCAALLFGGQVAQAEALKVGYLPATGHAKFFVAKEQNFFAEEGLDVQLVEFTNSADGLNAIIANKLDIGAFGTTGPLVHVARGSQLKIIGGIMGEDAALIARADRAESIRQVADLKDLKIATVRMASGDAVLRGALYKNGLSWKKDVELFELKNPPAVIEAVKSGQVDAGVVWGPHDLRAEAQGLKVVIRSADLEPGHTCCRLVVTNRRLAEQPDTWARFLRAILRAERFASEQREQTIDAIAKYIKLDRQLLEDSYYSPHIDQSSDPNLKGVQSFWSSMQASEFIPAGGDIDQAVNVELYAKVLDQLAAENPQDPFWQKLKAEYQAKDVL